MTKLSDIMGHAANPRNPGAAYHQAEADKYYGIQDRERFGSWIYYKQGGRASAHDVSARESEKLGMLNPKRKRRKSKKHEHYEYGGKDVCSVCGEYVDFYVVDNIDGVKRIKCSNCGDEFMYAGLNPERRHTRNPGTYAVVRKGGNIGSFGKGEEYHGMPIVTKGLSKEEAKEKAKRMRKHLTPTERKYYRMGYTIVDLKKNPGRRSAKRNPDKGLLKPLLVVTGIVAAISYMSKRTGE